MLQVFVVVKHPRHGDVACGAEPEDECGRILDDFVPLKLFFDLLFSLQRLVCVDLVHLHLKEKDDEDHALRACAA